MSDYKTCPVCGDALTEGEIYCSQCGSRLDEAQPGFRYVGFWRRVVAYLVDGIILSIVFGILSAGMSDYYASLLSFVGGWVYFAYLESSQYQGTLGKMLLGAKVVDYEGNRISFGKATLRHFSKIISAIILLIGFIMVAFTQKKQGLHDIIAGTLVIKKHR